VCVCFFFQYKNLIFSRDPLTIEKKLRVEDFRHLRQQFNRATFDGLDSYAKPNDRTVGTNQSSFVFMNWFSFSFRFIE